jgi:hypothetical protein
MRTWVWKRSFDDINTVSESASGDETWIANRLAGLYVYNLIASMNFQFPDESFSYSFKISERHPDSSKICLEPIESMATHSSDPVCIEPGLYWVFRENSYSHCMFIASIPVALST